MGGPQLIVDEEGVLDGFFPVYASEKTKANVLSFAEVEDLYDIMYICKRAFKEATQVIYNGHFRCCRINSIISIFEMKLKFLPIDFLPFYFAMVSLKSIN